MSTGPGRADEQPPTWLADWPRAFPRHDGNWTVSRGRAWGALEPERGRVWPALPTRDRRLPGIEPALAGGGSLVGYRVGRRAMVAADDRWIKVVRPSRLGRLAEVTRRVGAQLDGEGIAAPRVLADHGDGRVELSTVAGRSLNDLLRSLLHPAGPGGSGRAGSDTTTLEPIIDAVAGALARLHDLPIPDDEPGRPGGDEERRPDPPTRSLTLVARAEPAAADRLRHRLTGFDEPLRGGTRALVHGDLHDKNVLIGPGPAPAVGFIDLDGAGPGRAEDDVANLSVHLQLRALQSGAGVVAGLGLARRLVDAYARYRPIDGDRLEATERLTWFRLGCLYRFRASSRHLCARMIDLAGPDHHRVGVEVDSGQLAAPPPTSGERSTFGLLLAGGGCAVAKGEHDGHRSPAELALGHRERTAGTLGRPSGDGEPETGRPAS